MSGKRDNAAKILPFPQAKKRHGEKENDQSVLMHLPLVEAVAKRIHRKLPACVDLDDLISTGVLGLFDALKKFDAAKGVQFKTYAEYRIRGAIYDELRALDWIPRSVRRKKKLLENTQSKLSADRLGIADREEVREELKMDKEKFQDTLAKCVTATVVHLEDYMLICRDEKKQSKVFDNPMNAVTYQSNITYIHQMMDHLTDKEHQIVRYYYFEQKNIREIGGLLGITESRVSQLHMRAKEKLRNWMEGGILETLDLLAA